MAEDRAEWEGKVFVSEPFSRLPPLATTSCLIEDKGKCRRHHLEISCLCNTVGLQHYLQHELLLIDLISVELQVTRVLWPSAPPRTACPAKVRPPCSAVCPWELWSLLLQVTMLERSVSRLFSENFSYFSQIKQHKLKYNKLKIEKWNRSHATIGFCAVYSDVCVKNRFMGMYLMCVCLSPGTTPSLQRVRVRGGLWVVRSLHVPGHGLAGLWSEILLPLLW